MEDMSEKELRARRVTRDTAARKRGEKIMDAEPVEVRSCNGEVAKTCGSFEYLGSFTTTKCFGTGDQKENLESRSGMRKDVEDLGNERAVFEAKGKVVLSLCPFGAALQL